MTERKPNVIQKQTGELIEGLIFMRESGQHFFGVQTVFAPLIDKLIEKRRVQEASEAQQLNKDTTDQKLT